MSGKLKPYVYLIHDKLKNRPYYVGKHNGSNRKYITGSKILLRYIKIFGFESFFNRFEKIIIEYTTQNNLNNLEEYYVAYYGTYNKGGNLTKGGKWDYLLRQQPKKPILQYDLNGNFIKEWDYVRQPIDEGICTDYNGISACCMMKQKTSGGFIWRFKEKDVPLVIPIPKRKEYKKNVTRVKNQPIKINGVIYPSISSAARDFGWSFGKLNEKIKTNQINYKWIKKE